MKLIFCFLTEFLKFDVKNGKFETSYILEIKKEMLQFQNFKTIWVTISLKIWISLSISILYLHAVYDTIRLNDYIKFILMLLCKPVLLLYTISILFFSNNELHRYLKIYQADISTI